MILAVNESGSLYWLSLYKHPLKLYHNITRRDMCNEVVYCVFTSILDHKQQDDVYYILALLVKKRPSYCMLITGLNSFILYHVRFHYFLMSELFVFHNMLLYGLILRKCIRINTRKGK